MVQSQRLFHLHALDRPVPNKPSVQYLLNITK